ncbi:MAG: histidine--tRNA ligase [Acidimicrobiia bacterium]
MSFQPPKGVPDIHLPESAVWRRVLTAWEEWSERFGYPLILSPVFEATDLFERGVGDTTEVVTKQMYTFEDKGGRSVTLRPEGTAGVVRAFLDSGAQGAWKAAYSGPMFRYERPQKGRTRQFYQVGVEYLDVLSPLADVEVIELGYRFIKAVGLEELELRLNTLGDANCRPAYLDALKSYFSDRKNLLCSDSASLIEQNPLRILDCKVCVDVVQGAPAMGDYLCDECRDHYDAVRSGLDLLGVSYVEDPTLVRGLDYYSRTAFEYIGIGLDAAQNAVGGGGRYDGLAESLGGRGAPGVGFALGVDRIVLALDVGAEPALDIFVISETGPDEVVSLVSGLRLQGFAADYDLEGKSVKAQFKAAARTGAPTTIIYHGPGQDVSVRIEDERHEVPLQEVAQWLTGK